MNTNYSHGTAAAPDEEAEEDYYDPRLPIAKQPLEGGRLQVSSNVPAPSGSNHGSLSQSPPSHPPPLQPQQQQQQSQVANFNSNLHALLQQQQQQQQQQLFPAVGASLPFFVPPPRPSNILLEQLLLASTTEAATRNNPRRQLLLLQDAMVLDAAASAIQLRRQRQEEAVIIQSLLQQQQRPLATASINHAAASTSVASSSATIMASGSRPPLAAAVATTTTTTTTTPSTTIITHDEARRNSSSTTCSNLDGILDDGTKVSRRKAEEDSASSSLMMLVRGGASTTIGGRSLTPTRPSAPAGLPKSSLRASSVYAARSPTINAVLSLLAAPQRLHQPLDLSSSSSPSPSTTKPAPPPSQNAVTFSESGGQLQPPPSRPTSSPTPIIKPLSQYNYFFQDVRDFILNKMTQAERIGLTRCIMATEAPGATSKTVVGIERHLSPQSFLILHGPKHKDRLLQNHLQRDRTTRRKHRKGHGKLDFFTMNRAISALWKIMPDHGKQFYMDVCQADKQRYDAEMHKRSLANEKTESSSVSSPSPT